MLDSLVSCLVRGVFHSLCTGVVVVVVDVCAVGAVVGVVGVLAPYVSRWRLLVSLETMMGMNNGWRNIH